MKYIILLILIVLIAALYIRGIILERNRRRMVYDSFIKDYGTKRKKEYTHGKAHLDGILKRANIKDSVDEITWSDLDMDAVFERIDHTKSAAGEEYLYYLLHDTGNTSNAKEIDRLADSIEKDSSVMGDVMMSLFRLGYAGEISPLDQLELITDKKGRFPVIHLIADFLYIPAIVLIFIDNISPMIGAGLVFALLIFNIISYFRMRSDMEDLLYTLGFVIRLSSEAIYLNNRSFDFLKDENRRIEELTPFLRSVKSKGKYLSISGRSAGYSGSPMDVMLNYLNMIFHIDLIQYQLLIGKMSGRKEDIKWLFYLFGKTDAAVSVGDFRKSLDFYCKPCFKVFSASERSSIGLTVREGYHPLIEKHVDNSIDTYKGILLTGSNASGKSTFLRMIAVNAILAQTIYTACAKEYSAPVYVIYSSIALKDNLLGGESYFIVEIRSLKRIIDALDPGKPLLCFVDEVLRGTNTVERISASGVILEYLSGKNALCFAATHDGELADKMDGMFENYHFSETVSEESVKFDYLLKPGKAQTRNAIKLLKVFGYPECITEEASIEAVKLDSKG